MRDYPIFLYWENKKGNERPTYLDECLGTIRENNSNPKIWKLDLIAQRSDYFRYLLIHHNGGLWLDFDTICLRNLDPIFKKLKDYELVFQSEAIFAGRKGVFKDVIKDIENTIEKKMTTKFLYKIEFKRFLNRYFKIKFSQRKLSITPFKWTEIGIDCVLKHLNNYEVYRIEDYTHTTKMSYGWEPETNKLIFSDKIQIKDFINEKQMIVKLFNNMYDDNMKKKLANDKSNLFNKLIEFSHDKKANLI